ncbi:hypothetical protein ACWF94_37280 [Streptomyces sp. NPDC055078]
MQTSAVPDLAHTRTRPIHWLATATAMAAVVAAAGLLQPERATASPPDGKPKKPPVAAPAPDPADVRLPLECGSLGYVVVKKATGDLDGDGRPETIAAARCDAGSGSPPHGIYVLTTAEEGGPRLVATLLEPAQRRTAEALAIRDGAITATLLGYSSPEVPNCCPDQRDNVQWRWQGGKFIRTTQDEPRTV